MSSDLETFIEESIERSKAKGYFPRTFIQMRERWGTKRAIERLVISGDIQSGFRRLKELDLLDWSIEAAVLNFPDHFSKSVREAAEFRLKQAEHRERG